MFCLFEIFVRCRRSRKPLALDLCMTKFALALPSFQNFTFLMAGFPSEIFIELNDGYGFPNQGRVALYYKNQWGTVCDDSWDINDAHVVCRMLGYPKAIGFTTQSLFGGAKTGPIWLDEVNCTGTENTLAACPHGGWRISDCDHTEDAGVICDHNYTVDAKGKVKETTSAGALNTTRREIFFFSAIAKALKNIATNSFCD